MKTFLTFLITEIISREPEVLDYVFVYEMLTLYEEEMREVKPKIKKIIQEEHKKNFGLEVDYTSENLRDIGVDKKMTPISINYKKYQSKKIDKLVDKNFAKLDKQVKSQILNALNSKDIQGVINLLEKTLKNEKKSQSLVNNLMRVFRTESTKMRTKLKLDLQEELEKQGIKVRRRWVHTLYNPSNVILDNYTPREEHLMMHGQLEDSQGYFTGINGYTKGPGVWGLPEEDINCRCDIDFVLDE